MEETVQPAEGTQPERKKQKVLKILSVIWRWLLTVALIAALLFNIFTHILQVVSYNGTGMEPAIKGGQTLVLLRTQKVKEGDIIAFYFNNQVLIRRVVCTGGNQIEISKEGAVSINGTQLEEPYVKDRSIGQCNISFPYHVRTGTVFVMGDNREASMDSRLVEIGTVPTDRIIGKVLIII